MKKAIVFFMASFPATLFAVGGGGINLTPKPSAGMTPGASYYIQNTTTLQPGATIYVDSGTINNLNTSTFAATIAIISSGTVNGRLVVVSSLNVAGPIVSSNTFVGSDAIITRSTISSVGLAQGALAAPALYFAVNNGRTANGIYGFFQGVGINGNGGAYTFDPNGLTIPQNVQYLAPVNTNNILQYSFSGNTTTGLYMRNGDICLIFYQAGVEMIRFNNADKSIVFGGAPRPGNVALEISTSTLPNCEIVRVSSGDAVFSVTGSSGIFSSALSVINSKTAMNVSSFTLLVTTTPETYALAVSTIQHITFSGSSPTVSSCGSTPNGALVAGNDQAGTIAVGGGVVTACTLTFANPFKGSPGSPTCMISDNNAAVGAAVTSISNTAVTFGTSATLGGGKLYYHCFGVNE